MWQDDARGFEAVHVDHGPSLIVRSIRQHAVSNIVVDGGILQARIE